MSNHSVDRQLQAASDAVDYVELLVLGIRPNSKRTTVA